MDVIPLLNFAASVATAAATVALWRVTSVLAVETRRMAAAMAQPQVVMTIESNDWSFMHADMKIRNTGNATAFDVELAIDPALPPNADISEQKTTPFGKLSVLKPGQEMSSWVGRMYDLLDYSFMVAISWRRTPDGEREFFTYVLDMSSYRGLERLGSGDPVVQIANSAKHIREDIHKVISSGRVRVDSYDRADREEGNMQWQNAMSAAQEEPASKDSLLKRLIRKTGLKV